MLFLVFLCYEYQIRAKIKRTVNIVLYTILAAQKLTALNYFFLWFLSIFLVIIVLSVLQLNNLSLSVFSKNFGYKS